MPKSGDKGKKSAGKEQSKQAATDGLKLPFSKTRLKAPRAGYKLFTITTTIPLFAGSIIGSGGLPLLRIPEFIILVLILTIANWTSVYLCAEEGTGKGPWSGNRWLAISGLIQFGLVALFYQFTGQLAATGAGAPSPAAMALLLSLALTFSWPLFRLCSCAEDVLFDLALLIFSMAGLGVVAVYSQSGKLAPVTAILGMIPAAFLGAAKVGENAAVFEAEGWKRVTVVEKKGKTINRPGSLTRLFASLLVILPAIVVMVVPIGLLPPPFLILIAVLAGTPKIAQGFFEKSAADQQIAEKCLRLALAAAVVLGAAGWLSATT